MTSCDGCYYEDRAPMEMCNICTKNDDGNMSQWTARREEELQMQGEGSVLPSPSSAEDNPSGGCAATSPYTGEALDGAWADWSEGEPERDKDLLIDHLKKRIYVLEKERDDCAAGYDYLQCRIDDLQEQMGKLEAENEYLRKSLDWNKREQDVLSAKVEMVYLIFGDGGDG